jgi:hypothetical protein
MKSVTCCERCGHKLIPTLGLSGRTELACLWCEDPLKTEAAKWAESPLAEPVRKKATTAT